MRRLKLSEIEENLNSKPASNFQYSQESQSNILPLVPQIHLSPYKNAQAYTTNPFSHKNKFQVKDLNATNEDDHFKIFSRNYR